MTTRQDQVKQLEQDWANNPRWQGIKRGYSAEDVVRLRDRSSLNKHSPAAVQSVCGK